MYLKCSDEINEVISDGFKLREAMVSKGLSFASDWGADGKNLYTRQTFDGVKVHGIIFSDPSTVDKAIFKRDPKQPDSYSPKMNNVKKLKFIQDVWRSLKCNHMAVLRDALGVHLFDKSLSHMWMPSILPYSEGKWLLHLKDGLTIPELAPRISDIEAEELLKRD